MPYINIQITEGATRLQKQELVRLATEMVVDVLEKSPENTHVVIQEIPEDNWGLNNRLYSEFRENHL